MKAVGVQMDLAWHDPATNLARAQAEIRRAAAGGAQLVALPEMFATGFSMDVGVASGARLQTEEVLAGLARELGIVVVAGLAERAEGDEAGRGLNLALAWGPAGRLARYEKIHPFSYAREHLHYRGGSQVTHFEWGGVCVCPFVCYDLRFPEIFRAVVPKVQLGVVIANWPAARAYAWRSLLVARAIENQCYVLGVNRVGSGGGLAYTGDSMLVDPLGEVLDTATQVEAHVGGEISIPHLEQVRTLFPFLQDRRPELYPRLGLG